MKQRYYRVLLEIFHNPQMYPRYHPQQSPQASSHPRPHNPIALSTNSQIICQSNTSPTFMENTHISSTIHKNWHSKRGLWQWARSLDETNTTNSARNAAQHFYFHPHRSFANHQGKPRPNSILNHQHLPPYPELPQMLSFQTPWLWDRLHKILHLDMMSVAAYDPPDHRVVRSCRWKEEVWVRKVRRGSVVSLD